MGGLFSKPKIQIAKAPEIPKAPEVIPVAPEPPQFEDRSAQLAMERERRRRIGAYGRQQTVAGGLTGTSRGTSSTMQAGSKGKMGE